MNPKKRNGQTAYNKASGADGVKIAVHRKGSARLALIQAAAHWQAFCALNEIMETITKGKRKRRRQGKAWLKDYKGKNILHAYKRKFKIPLIAAINDLESLGVPLDRVEVARIKIDRHYNGEQQINNEALAELRSIVSVDSDS